MPPAFLFPEIEKAELKDNSRDRVNNNNNDNNENNGNLVNANVINNKNINGNNNQDNGSITSNNTDETDKSSTPASTPTLINDEKSTNVEEIIRRKRNIIGDNVKAKLARRVSFDPLALLLDASLEGELELVKKTATQVPNPSAANDEGITALHNAICAGHLEIVK
jgi:apoptosis-stimulating of p53 protein 1